MRVPVRTALVAAVLVTVGCYTYRPVARQGAPGAEVRIVLRSAAVVVTVGEGGDGTRRSYPDVVEVRGTIRTGGDTLSIRLGDLRTAAGSVPDVSGPIALLPAAEIGEIRERRLQGGRTLLAVGGLALIIATIVTAMQVSVATGWQ